MEAEESDESALFDALAAAGVRYMLIGRRAIAALGAPILTADYDLWGPLIAWFVRRYPTPEARLAYARRHGRLLRARARSV
jgi:hypothetical protein